MVRAVSAEEKMLKPSGENLVEGMLHGKTLPI